VLASVGLNLVQCPCVLHRTRIGVGREVDARAGADWTNGLPGVDSVPCPAFDPLERHMTSAKTNGLVTDIAGLRDRAGTHIGYTDWQEMTQERVNQFADATDDHQFIHVDVEKAKQTPFGGTIAHGFLTLSLVAPVSQQLMQVSDAVMGVNYGLDRVRFPAPLPVGARWRGGMEIVEVTEIPGGVQIKSRITIEVKDSEKPACVADSLVRVYGGS
jgi:acyl dehydratase